MLVLALLLTLAFAGVEAAAGWWAGSLALLGDAGHMLTDSMALAIATAAAWLSRRPPSPRHSFGLARVEVLAGLVNAGFMTALVLALAWNALHRLAAPRAVDGEIVAWVAAAGLALNVAVAALLSHGEQNLNTRAALLHVIADALGSVAALVSGLVVSFTGWTRIDPLLSLAIGALIMGSTLRLARDAAHTLLEGVPRALSLPVVGSSMARSEGVLSVHDLHIWEIASGQVSLSAHVVLAQPQEWPRVLSGLRHLLHEQFDIQHVTLQPETPRPEVIALTRMRRSKRPDADR
jgi:cobalt-zinc-cadmium efflux system protein